MDAITINTVFPIDSQVSPDIDRIVKVDEMIPEVIAFSNDSTVNSSNTKDSDVSSNLKKRKAKKTFVDASDPAASLMDIIMDPKLAVSTNKNRKIRKTSANSDEITTNINTAAQPAAKKLVIKDGKITFEETVNANAAQVADNVVTRVTSASFRPSNHVDRWDDEETAKFFQALAIFGSDFSMIATLFPKRTRDQVKRKFNREEKTNAKKVNAALDKHWKRISIPKKLINTIEASGNLPELTFEKTESTASNGQPIVDEINDLLANIVKDNKSAADWIAITSVMKPITF